ncbi:LuxR C-terminal-related transcriptional regulator [Bradyrhizobium stylosanthis]|nr:LuxR C-terminal-related transcriptional regulator [Bradyrhizobium stylosanthis]
MLDVTAQQGIIARIRLVIVDRQPIVLQGLKSVLGAQHDFDVVASVSDGASCLDAIRTLSPDVALLADTLPDLTVSEILAIAKAENLPTRLVFFTESDHDLTAAIAAGTCSAISKYAAPDTMLRSLRLMAKRGVLLQQSDLSPADKGADSTKIEKMMELLTQRERQIVRLVSEGMSNKEIARKLNLSQGTVKVHLYNIFQKLEITNRTVLATIALLQRTSVFGTLSLALLALAIADELKAAEANDRLPNGHGISHAGEHAEYEPWKKAILRHLAVSASGETPQPTLRDFFAKVGQVANPAAAIEALRAAEQFVSSKSLKDYGPVGSSTPYLPALLLRGTNDAQAGDDTSLEHQFPRLAANPMSLHSGYGTFATLAGALIYALHDPHLAGQPHDPAKALADSLLAGIGDHATTKVAGADAGASHVDPTSGFLSHDVPKPAGFVTGANDGVAGEGAQGPTSQGAASDGLQKTVGLQDSGHGAGAAGDGHDQAMGDNADKNVAPSDASFTSSQSAFDFASGSGRLNLAAFGALAWLHMTAASKSIPPHTLAWVYNAATNETIVYVNATDRVLDIGERGLLEIHLQGIVSIAEADGANQPDGAVVAATLEKLEEALISVTATDDTGAATDNVHAVGGASESTVETAGAWSIRADGGLRFQFGQTRTGLGPSTKFETSSGESANATEDSDGAPVVLAHVSSTAVARSETAATAENPTSKTTPISADTGVVPTGLSETVQPSVVTSDNANHGNSQHGSESESASGDDADKPGNGVGRGTENHASDSDLPPGLAKKADATEATDADSKPGNGAEKHTSDSDLPPGLAKKADATEATDADSKPGNGAEKHASDSDLPPGLAKKADATKATDADSKPGNGAEKHASDSDLPPGLAKKADATEATDADSKPGNGAEKHASDSDLPPGLAKKADATEATDADSKPGNGAEKHASDSDLPPGLAKKADATEATDADSKPGNGAEQQASAADLPPGLAKKADATEATDADSKPGNGAEQQASAADLPPGLAKKADSSDDEHGNSGHSNAADVPDAAETVVTADSADHGNSQHASNNATDSTEADTKPGNGVGNIAEQQASASDLPPGLAKKADSSDDEHGNSGHSNAADAPVAAETVVAADSADHGNSQHASNKATDSTEADTRPGNGVGNIAEQQASDSSLPPGLAKKADSSDDEHGNSGHSNSADAPDAAETVVAADSADHGNSQHASEPTQTAAMASTDADANPGNGAEQQASDLPPGLAKKADVSDVEHGNSGHSNAADAPDTTAIVVTADSADHGNPQHASEPTQTAAMDSTDADANPGNGAEQQASDLPPGLAKKADVSDVEHGNSDHSNSADAPDATATVETIVVTADSADHGNSQHASEPTQTAAMDPTDADANPGNGAEQQASDLPPGLAKKADASDVEHGNSDHSNSADAPDATATVETSVVTADNADHGNSQQASEPTQTAATDSTDADAKPGNGVGNSAEQQASDLPPGLAKKADASDVEHGNSDHSNSADAPDATETVETSVATVDSGDHGNSQHAAQPATTASETAPPTAVATVGADQEPVFNFDNVAPSATLVAVVPTSLQNDPIDVHVPPGQQKIIEAIAQMTPQTLDDNAAGHVNNGHHGNASAHHDLLI